MQNKGGSKMEMAILKKKMDGYRDSAGRIRNVPPELLLELRQTWEHFVGSPDQFRSELGVRSGTLRNLLKESKKLNHVLASAGAVGLSVENGNGESDSAQITSSSEGGEVSGNGLILTFDNGAKSIRFPNVDLLIDFMRRAA
jgi:hypothetical protein